MEQWPSNRVAQGGIFQPAKVTYSPKTQQFLQDLMQESKLSMMQRKKINYFLRSGDPLPSLSNSNPPKKSKKPPAFIVRPGSSSKRRQLSSIVESGAYEHERYIPIQKGMDREFAKKHLQDFMAYGKEIKETPRPKKKIEDDEPPMNRFDEIKKEIQERVDWLADMEKLGEGHKYKILIQQQIAARIREMEKLQPSEPERKNKENPFLGKKHVAALILARGGSKGIPLKNLALVNGQSLLSRSLSVVCKVKHFDSIWVSTDHELIVKEAENFGVQIHWRKPETATDEATSIFAVQEFIQSHPEVDVVALIQCTSPFIRKQFLLEAFDAVYHGIGCAFAVTHSFKLRWVKSNQIKAINFNPQQRPRRQDWPGEYVENGMFYFTTRKLITKGLFQNNE